MIRKYDICGLVVECDFRYEIMLSRSEKFLSECRRQADISIAYNKERHCAILEKAPQFSEKDAEVMATSTEFYSKLIDYEGFMLHSSAVMVDGNVYLFSAPSGTGKSTHTRQWLKLFGNRAVIINDDKPALRVIDGKVYAYGTPWSGSSELNEAVSGRLKGICVLSRSEENFIEPISQGDGVFALLNQTIRPTSPQQMDKLLELIDKVVGSVKMWKMGCNISVEAAKTAYDAMSK